MTNSSDQNKTTKNGLTSWQVKMHDIIYEADTPAGKLFDVVLLWAILLSVLAVMLESVGWIEAEYGKLLFILEWVFTGFFTVEYVLRIITVRKPMSYILSFYGIVDLLSLLPTYIGLFIGPNVNASALRTIRAIRLLRVFRIFKLGRYLGEAKVLTAALRASRPKITVFLFAVLALVIIMGTIMYLIEGGKDSDFTSIPRSIYWAIVTLTTVGYGDISPATPLGQFFASIIMILGYAIIAVPTGIVSSEIAKADSNAEVSNLACDNCSREGHDPDAEFCKYCGASLDH